VRLLIIGVNGFLGRAIATRAAESNIEVFGLSRSREPAPKIPGTHLVGDRNSPETIGEIVEDNAVDVVVDVLAMTLRDTRALVSELDGRIAQYVMLSSSDVYRNYELLHRNAHGTPILEGLTEDAPLRVTRYPYRTEPPRVPEDPERHLDEYDKIPIEEMIRGLGVHWTILRLPMVYGPGDRQHRFRWVVQHMLQTQKPLKIPRQWAEWVTTHGYVENVAAGVALCVGSPRAIDTVFNIGECIPVDKLTWAERIAECLSWTGEIQICDDTNCDFAQSLEALDLSVPFLIDSTRIRKELGYSEPVSIPDGLQRTISDERGE